MNKSTAILTVCESGEDRSVCLATVLKHDRGYNNVLNCGIEKVTPKTFAMLARWADHIYVVADSTVWRRIPATFKAKATFLNIGFDIWRSPTNPALVRICRQQVARLGL